MAIQLEYRKTGAKTWLLATEDLVETFTITDLDNVEYDLRAYDTEADIYSQIITQIANGGVIDVTVPSSLVTSTVNTGINITDNTIYPKNGTTDIPFSIEIWVKPQSIETTMVLLNAIDSSNESSMITLVFEVGGVVRFAIQMGSSSNRISLKTGTGAVDINNWYQIVVTYDGSKTLGGINMYINSVLRIPIDVSQGNYTGMPALLGDFKFRIPITNTNESVKFIGKINLFRFFLNKVLSESEIIELYNEMKTTPLDGLAFANTCVLEHRFNNNVFSHIGEDATPVGVLTYDNDLPWSVPVNEVDFYSYTSLTSVMWTKMFKSSDWPEITTTKPYFVLYSSDHSTTGGGIAWAECDDVYFNGFVERGIILTGYQCETPWLIRIPTAVSGLTTDTIFLYYHTVTGEPGNDNKQQTRLRTCAGGLLHTATWTDRGRPLGIYNDDVHTGYCRVFQRDNGTFVANHLTVGGSDPKTYISESTDGLTFTRLQETTSHTVEGYFYGKNHINPFKRNDIWYGFVRLKIDGGEKLAVVTLDSNFLPATIVQVLPDFYTMNIVMSYEEADTAYINIRYSSSALRDRNTYMVEYDLTQLD